MSNCNNFIKRVIGVTRTFNWTITTNGAAVPLVAEDLTLQLVPPRGEAVSLPFDVDDNIVSFTWQGEDQHIIGCYSLILWANYGEDNQRRVDIHNFVELIPWSDRQSGEYSDLVEETIELETADFGENIMVVDNLNSTSATDALSANMGRQLNVTKQDVIQDLATIRSGAAAGAAVKEWAKNDPLITDDATQASASRLNFNGNLFEQWVPGIAASIGLKGIAGFLKLADISQWDSAYNDRMLPTVAAVKAKLQAVLTALATIEAVIPSQASSTNKLTDKDYVDGAIATNTANFVGTFDTLAELRAVPNPTKNDYGFVIEQDAQGNEYYDRYKYTGTQWLYEYKVESTPFTTEQWAAIQSGITAALVSKLSALPTNAELNTALASKQPVINDLTTIRSGAAAGATAYQKPSGGIPASDMASAVQTSLGKADAAAPQATTYTKTEVDAALALKQTSSQLATINGSDITHGGNVTIVAAEGQTITIDAAPTGGSNNAVSSGGVFDALASAGVYDVSAKNSGATFASLSALLSNANLSTLIPTAARKGGMSIRFVSSSDNKYVQYRLMTDTFSTTESDWQGVDDEPTAGSKNLVESGGTYEEIHPSLFNTLRKDIVATVKELYIDKYIPGLKITAFIWTGSKVTFVIKDENNDNVAFVNNVDLTAGEVLEFTNVGTFATAFKGYIVVSSTTINISSINVLLNDVCFVLGNNTIIDYFIKKLSLIDSVPTENSTYPVQSGGVYAGINNLQEQINVITDTRYTSVAAVNNCIQELYITGLNSGDYMNAFVWDGSKITILIKNANSDIVLFANAQSATAGNVFYYTNNNGVELYIILTSSTYSRTQATIGILDSAKTLSKNFNILLYIDQTKSKDGIAALNKAIQDLCVSRFSFGTLPSGVNGSYITINRRMDDVYDSVLAFANKMNANVTNHFFDYYAFGKHAKGVDAVSECSAYTDYTAINNLSTSDAIMMAIVVGAVNNADGDNPTMAKWHTGGAHAYGDVANGPTPTMREISNTVKVDGNIVNIGDKGVRGNSCTIELINNIQGYNTCKEDGTGREIVQQKVHVDIQKDLCVVTTEIVALEDVILYGSNSITGMNVNGMTGYKFIGSLSKKGVYDVTHNAAGVIPDDGDNRINSVQIENDGYLIDTECDLEYGLGNKLMGSSYNLSTTSAKKAYFQNIPSLGQIELNEGESIFWKITLKIRKK